MGKYFALSKTYQDVDNDLDHEVYIMYLIIIIYDNKSVILHQILTWIGTS